jgi:hypothetical protein
MKKILRNSLHATLTVTLVALAGTAVAQTSADKSGKSTSGTTPQNTPVTPGAPGYPVDDSGYTRYWTSMDKNGDGRVSRDEYLAYYGTRYDTYDTTKRGYYDRQSLRGLYLDRELSKTDGQPMGSPMNPTTKK